MNTYFKFLIISIVFLFASNANASDYSNFIDSLVFANIKGELLKTIGIAQSALKEKSEAYYIYALDSIQMFRPIFKKIYYIDTTNSAVKRILEIFDACNGMRLKYMEKPFLNPAFSALLTSDEYSNNYIMPSTVFWSLIKNEIIKFDIFKSRPKLGIKRDF